MMFLLIGMLVGSAQAAETSFGIGSSIKSDDTAFQLNYRDPVWNGTYLQLKAGWFGRPHIGAGGGLLVEINRFQTRGGLSMGPTLNTALIELNPEFYVGFRDTHGNAVGLQFDHFTANSGRNYVSVQMTQEF